MDRTRNRGGAGDGGGDERHATSIGKRGEREATLAAASATEDEVRRSQSSRVLPRRPVDDVRPDRFPGSRIDLLSAPSQPPRRHGQWSSRISSPITVTGSRRLVTAFPTPGCILEGDYFPFPTVVTRLTARSPLPPPGTRIARAKPALERQRQKQRETLSQVASAHRGTRMARRLPN